jgi:hypothetical protein
MITERRQILFSNEALREAVVLLRDSYPDRVPMGQVRRVWTLGEAAPQLVVQLEKPGARALHEHVLSQREIAAAVILLCRKLKVPLPRSSDKYLEVEGGALSLVITKQVPLDAQAGA